MSERAWEPISADEWDDAACPDRYPKWYWMALIPTLPLDTPIRLHLKKPTPFLSATQGVRNAVRRCGLDIRIRGNGHKKDDIVDSLVVMLSKPEAAS